VHQVRRITPRGLTMTEDEILQNINKLQKRYNTDDIDLKYSHEPKIWSIVVCTYDKDGYLLNSKGWAAKELQHLFNKALTGDLKT
jgi:diketogulonate reductase-like aldo/keto reductase